MSESSVAPDFFISFGAGIDMNALEFKVDPATNMEMLANVSKGAFGYASWLSPR
jgi:hypothetical protein